MNPVVGLRVKLLQKALLKVGASTQSLNTSLMSGVLIAFASLNVVPIRRQREAT